MKHKKILIYILSMVTTLTSCKIIQVNSDKFVGYADGSIVTNSNLNLSMSISMISNMNESYYVMCNLFIENTDSNSVTTSLNNFECFRESDGADYGVASYSKLSEITFRCDLKWKSSFTITLPTSPENETYFTTFDLCGSSYKFYLSNKPEELKRKYSVNLYIHGSLAKTESISEATSLSNIEWISTDYAYCCSDWFYDEAFSDPVGKDILTNNINLYGKSKSILNYLKFDSYYGVWSINYVPKSNEIVIPKKLGSFPVRKILSSAFSYSLNKISTLYIPNTILNISRYGFTNANYLKKIYYEGSSSQWKSIIEAPVSSDIEIIFNNYI